MVNLYIAVLWKDSWRRNKKSTYHPPCSSTSDRALAFQSSALKVLCERAKAFDSSWFWWVTESAIVGYCALFAHKLCTTTVNCTIFLSFLFWSVAFDEVFEAELLNNGEAIAEVSLFVKSSANEMAEICDLFHCWNCFIVDPGYNLVVYSYLVYL